MSYYTADLHLGHEAIIRYCNRPFTTIDEMGEAIVNNWNAVVGKTMMYMLSGMCCSS